MTQALRQTPGSLTPEQLGRVKTWLEAQDFPHEWKIEQINQCWIIEIFDDNEKWKALIWYHWQPGMDRVLQVHGCAAKDQIGRWLTPGLLGSLLVEKDKIGAKAFMAHCPTPHLKKLWTRLGFQIIGEFAYEREEPDG